VPHAGHGQYLGEFPHVQRWFHTIRRRPATLRTYANVKDVYAKPGNAVAERAPEGKKA